MNGRHYWLMALLLLGAPSAQAVDKAYLYYRDANVPPFQESREFFNMPNRVGLYEVTLVSDSVGPLTFRMARVHEELETTLAQLRSYHIGNHEFHARFDNRVALDDLIVEIANSNPLSTAHVSVIVVELARP
ncbi:MAG: hypothetical protein Q9M31_01055 [Mariprofundus sp.]|nr:hypothetical protein [Mariprofundus sp.]